MLRAQYERRGPVPQDVIGVVEFDTPRLGAGQALVEVIAAPINPADVLTLTGEYGVLPALPAIGGREGVGRVAELGCDAGEVALGQMVLLPLGCGSWSSHVVTEAAQLRSLPEDADPLHLSMMAINPPTAALLMSEFVTLGPGDWVIQNAANSAVGSYLVQLARYRGYRTGSPPGRGCGRARERRRRRARRRGGPGGAGRRGDRRSGDPARHRCGERRRQPATRRLPVRERDTGQLRPPERPAVCGATGRLTFRDLTLRGFWLVNWFRRTPEDQRRVLVDELAGLIARKILHAPIHATYDVSEIKDAVATAASGERSGKVLIVPRR